MPTKLEKAAKEKGIEYFLISFVDILGKLRSKMVPARAIGPMEKDGAGFAGFAAYLNISPADGDTMAIPDPDSLLQIPWRPEVGWLAADLSLEGEPVEASPRVALKKQLAKAEKLGYRMKTGVECEFFLINQDGTALADSMDTDAKPCYDQHALMRVYPYAKEMCDSMLKMGFSPYQLDHEDANGQFEMNWDYDDALKTADRHVFFKYMTRELAERHGMRATYMPKPFWDRTGSGCHAHISLWDKTGIMKIRYRTCHPHQLVVLPGSHKQITFSTTPCIQSSASIGRRSARPDRLSKSMNSSRVTSSLILYLIAVVLTAALVSSREYSLFPIQSGGKNNPPTHLF